MLLRHLRNVLLLGIVAAGAAGIGLLHRHHRRLEQRVAILRQQDEQAARQREERRRTQSLITRAQAGDADAARLVHAELLQARAEVARLEHDAQEQYRKKMAQASATAEALANNRDPEKGMMRLEYFQNVGHGTPSAAFQTLIWAVVKGKDDSVAEGLLVTGAVREQAEALIASLPEAARVAYPTPEKLVGLSLANIVLDQTAIQVLDQNPTGSATTDLNIKGLEAGPQKFSFQLGANGWQLVVPPQAIRSLQRTLAGGSPFK
jgi:hypothetical protein